MSFQFAWRVRVFDEVLPVSFPIAEQAVHDGTSERTIGSRLHQHRQVRLVHGAVHVDVHNGDFRAAFFARAHRMLHDVDLGIDRIGAPDHDQVGLGHFARIDPGYSPDARREPGIGRIDANG